MMIKIRSLSFLLMRVNYRLYLASDAILDLFKKEGKRKTDTHTHRFSVLFSTALFIQMTRILRLGWSETWTQQLLPDPSSGCRCSSY